MHKLQPVTVFTGLNGVIGFVVLFLLVGVVALAAPDQFVIGNFSADINSGTMPEGWKPLVFKDIDTPSQYRHLVVDGLGIIEARSENGASGLTRELNIDPNQFSVITWQWKVSGVLQKGDVSKKSGDDYPARIYITFAYDPDKVGFWEKVKFNAIKLIYGEYPPINAINYIWANKAKVGLMVPNPYTDRVKMFVVESGPGRAGQWIDEKRNIVDDYRLAFNEDPPEISGIAIMTDTDNTGETVTAWYGDIIMWGQ